jgi:hypothetical protein
MFNRPVGDTVVASPATSVMEETHMESRKAMTRLRRFALVVTLVFGGSLAMAAAGVAAVGGLTPGNYIFTNTSATAIVGVAVGGPPEKQGVGVFVNRGLNSFRPAEHKGPRTVASSTMVQVAIFDSSGSTFGCFIVPPSAFTVSKDLQSASLHTTLTVDRMCPGVGEPVTGKSDIISLAGGGGLPLPMNVDITWTGLGVTSTGRDHSTFQCLDYSTQFSNDSHSSVATASGTIAGLSGSFNTDVANVDSTDSRMDIKGTPPPACFGV